MLRTVNAESQESLGGQSVVQETAGVSLQNLIVSLEVADSVVADHIPYGSVCDHGAKFFVFQFELCFETSCSSCTVRRLKR